MSKYFLYVSLGLGIFLLSGCSLTRLTQSVPSNSGSIVVESGGNYIGENLNNKELTGITNVTGNNDINTGEKIITGDDGELNSGDKEIIDDLMNEIDKVLKEDLDK